jgi:hypothetical protein
MRNLYGFEWKDYYKYIGKEVKGSGRSQAARGTEKNRENCG